VAYVPLQQPSNLQSELATFITGVMDPFYEEIHFLLTLRIPGQGPKGSMQRLQMMALLAATDAAAKVCIPGKMGNGARFKQFLRQHFPWADLQPDGLTIDEACDVLWKDMRNPLIHLYGSRPKSIDLIKLGNTFSLDDVPLQRIEENMARPPSTPAIKRGNGRVVIWAAPYYWGLRRTIFSSVNDPRRARAIVAWIKSEKFHH
jgi:hypothetical protein